MRNKVQTDTDKESLGKLEEFAENFYYDLFATCGFDTIFLDKPVKIRPLKEKAK